MNMSEEIIQSDFGRSALGRWEIETVATHLAVALIEEPSGHGDFLAVAIQDCKLYQHKVRSIADNILLKTEETAGSCIARYTAINNLDACLRVATQQHIAQKLCIAARNHPAAGQGIAQRHNSHLLC